MDLSSMNAFHDAGPQEDLQEEADESLSMEMDECEMRELEHRTRHKVRRHAIVGETVPRKCTCRPYPHPKTREERAMLLHMLGSLPFLVHLPEWRLQMIVDAFERCVLPPGEAIRCANGDISHEFYWIECGSVVSSGCSPSSCSCCVRKDYSHPSCNGIAPQHDGPGPVTGVIADDPALNLLNVPKHEEGVLCRCGSSEDNSDAVLRGDSNVWRAGEFFSAEQLLYMYNPRVDHDIVRYTAPYAITEIEAETTPAVHSHDNDNVILWKISRLVLKTILMMDALRREQKLVGVLNTNTLLSILPRREKLLIADALMVETYTPGTCLLQEGAIPDRVFFIDTGIVDVTRAVENSVAAHARFLSRKSCIAAALITAAVIGSGDDCSAERSAFSYTVYSHTTCYYLRYCDMRRVLDISIIQQLAGVRNIHAHQVEEQHAGRRELSVLEEELEAQRYAASDSGSEVEYTDDMCPVYVKTSEDDVWLQRFLTSSNVYGTATSMQRGLAAAAIAPREELPYGYVLYRETPTPLDADETCVDSNATCEEYPQRYLWIIAEGQIGLLQHGMMVATRNRGDTVGEELLLRKRWATPATTAIVTSPTCSVYKLDRKTFRCLLMKACVRELQSRRPLLMSTPLVSGLCSTAVLLLCSGATRRMWMPGEVMIPQGLDVSYVEVLLEGTVDVTSWHCNPHEAQQEHEKEEETENNGERRSVVVISTLRCTDIIGALELYCGCPSMACYLTRSRVHTLRIPAALFVDSCLRSPAVLEYLTELQQSTRYALPSSGPRALLERNGMDEQMSCV